MNFSCYQFPAIGLSFMLAVCVSTTVVGATHLTLRERVMVETSVVRLGDVAEVASADRTQGRQLAAIPLMPSPPAGGERYLSRREIEDLLAAHGYDLRGFEVEGAQRIAISTSSTKPAGSLVATHARPMNRREAILAGHVDGAAPIAGHELKDGDQREGLTRTIASYLEAQTGRVGNWKVACDLAERHVALLDAATSPIVCQGGGEPWVGRQRFVIAFSTAQGDLQIPVYADVVNASAQVAVAVRPIARGEVITAADVEMQPLESAPSAVRRPVVESLDQLVGMEARQAIQMGDVIFTDHIQAPILVKRGEEVTVVSNSGGIRVRTTARARQDGARGQLVQVETLETKDRYDVWVVGRREAAVFSAVSSAIAEPPAKQIETARR